ncbi:MAG: type IV pilin protein [Granulosicoccus sp.]
MNRLCAKIGKQAGYSLIELMVALAVLGIVSSAATVGYGKFSIKAKRQDAITLLSSTVLRLERCFTLEGSYNGACTLKNSSDDGFYSLVTDRQAQSYTLSAVPVPGRSQANDAECGTFEITSTAVKSATGSLNQACW